MRFFRNRGCAKNTHLMYSCATWVEQLERGQPGPWDGKNKVAPNRPKILATVEKGLYFAFFTFIGNFMLV